MFVYKVLFVCSLFAIAYGKQCYWNSKDRYSYFGAITPYDDVRGDIRDEPPLEGCAPVSLWALVRHGTRHPGDEETEPMRHATALRDTIVSNYHGGLGQMCAQDITDLTNWRWDDSLDSTQNYLTPEGHEELLHLGQRVREKFSPLLGDLDTYQFRPTNKQRTKASAQGFVEGLGGNYTIEEALESDNIIMPYNQCQRFNNDISNSGTALEGIFNKLYQTEDYKQMLISVRQRVGIPDLSTDNITALYGLCRYYRAYAVDRQDPWCSLFNNEDLLVLEYVSDLMFYYGFGYGSSTASRLGAPPLGNLLQNLEASVKGSKRVTGYFSHDIMLAMMHTSLGLFYDYPEISGLQIDPDRKWRTSFTTPFASNFIVVLNKCPAGKGAVHKVQLFINEKMVPLCGERACPWKDFREKLLRFRHTRLDFCAV